MNSVNTFHNKNINDETAKTDRLEPPAASIQKGKNRFLMILQLAFFFLILLPILLIYSIIEDIFFIKPKCLKGKVVLITGAGRGLGRGFALKFSELGCKVACVDVDETTNEETAQIINEQNSGKAKNYTCDVCITKEIQALRQAVYEDFGHVDILVNNAGIISGCPITDCEDIYIHGMINVNLTSHIIMIREFLPNMLERNEGHIVAISSMAGFTGLANECIYAATKHGVVGLMEALHHDLKQIENNQVKTSVVCSWFVNTSASYTKWWDLSIPEFSIADTINAAIAGIRKNKRVISIPSRIYYGLHLGKLLPERIYELGKSIVSAKINFPPIQIQKTSLPYKILLNSMKKIDLGLKDS